MLAAAFGDTLDPNTPGFDPDFFGPAPLTDCTRECIPLDWWRERARRGELGAGLFPGGLPIDPGDLATEIAPAVEAEAQRQEAQKRRGLWIGLGVAAGALVLLGGVVAVARR